MHSDSSRPPSSLPTATSHDAAAQESEDWAATIAQTVAATLEPSCALAFCFGYHFGGPRASEKSDAT